MDGYWKSVEKAAFERTVASLGGMKMLRTFLIFSAIAIIGLLIWGSSEGWSDFTIEKVSIAAAIALWFPVLYVWNLTRVPVEQDAILREALERIVPHGVV